MLSAVFVCVIWIVSLCLHEFGHATVAYWGGDKTVKDKGYLTLNPLAYTDPGLTLILPIVFLMLGGIALPGAAVYINRKNLRNRLWASAVSVAGPAMTSLVAILLALPFTLGLAPSHPQGWFWPSLALLAFLEVVAVLLNSLPLPPLDGFGVIEPWLPLSLQASLKAFQNYGMLILFAVLWFVQPVNDFLWTTAFIIVYVLGVPPELVQDGYHLFRSQTPVLVLILIALAFILRRRK